MSDKSQKEKPCPYCQSVKNEWGTCSWHCATCANTDKNCLNECNYKHSEESVFDEDDYLHGDQIIDPEMGSH